MFLIKYFKHKREQKDLALIARCVAESIKAVKPTVEAATQEYLVKDEALIIQYLIVSLRGEYLYYLAQKLADPNNIPKLDFYYSNEKKSICERFKKLFPDKEAKDIEELVSHFYPKK